MSSDRRRSLRRSNLSADDGAYAATMHGKVDASLLECRVACSGR